MELEKRGDNGKRKGGEIEIERGDDGMTAGDRYDFFSFLNMREKKCGQVRPRARGKERGAYFKGREISFWVKSIILIAWLWLSLNLQG